nr:hypothetical protein [Tanacetum cinerariifolium]
GTRSSRSGAETVAVTHSAGAPAVLHCQDAASTLSGARTTPADKTTRTDDPAPTSYPQRPAVSPALPRARYPQSGVASLRQGCPARPACQRLRARPAWRERLPPDASAGFAGGL